jgi:beta-lactamase class A
MTERDAAAHRADGPDTADAASLAERIEERIEAALAPLGGRTAVAAQRFGPARRRDAEGERATRGETVRRRADDNFPAASLAKLPIAVELLRRADLGQLDLAERLDTSAAPRAGGGGVLDYLDPSTQLTLDDLCTLMLIVSDNTAANVLLDLVGMGEVNESLRRLNLAHTTLARHFMDFAAREAHRDNLTTANDMLALLTLVRGGALPGARRLHAMLAAQQSLVDLKEAWLPAQAQLAHKDGLLDDTLHDAGILTGPGGASAYCVLTTEQRDVPAARTAVCRVVRLLWDAWCA